jgi:3-hydroxymyristoyl/3-hydroxydecanoyl-(acyl carrier protein) dehydratase
MMMPQVLRKQRQDNHLTLDLILPADLFWFKGHFPGQPILPGVAQINWVMHYAGQEMGLSGRFGGFDVVKFQQPVLPQQQIRLAIDWLAEKNRLIFSYHVGDRQASSGKIILCP